MKLPKITIITPSYNQGEFLEDTFRSVLDQQYPNLEYFVVDGGSKDNSVAIIQRYAQHFDWWVSEKDRGQSHAINKGLERATGDLVIWLNSDDFFYPGALDYVSQAWQAHPEAGLFVGNGTLADRAGRRVRRYSKTLAWDYDILLRGANYILQPSTFLARRVFQEQGFIDEKITYGMDLELWLRVGNKYPVVTIDEELAAFRWYDEVKSVAGGFKEWIAMYEMTRRYCPDPITPGLVLEFFKKLQDPKVQAAAGFEGFGQFAQVNYWKFYQQMQQMLGTVDCIPVINRGIAFVPDKRKRQPQALAATAATSVSTSIASSPAPQASRKKVVDVVLPAGHSWFVREGYVEALKAAGCLGRVFCIPSWAKDDQRCQELFDYLPQSQADAILLMDTLWHAQSVHATEAWRQRWMQCHAKKIMFSFECMNNPVIRQNPRWWQDNVQAIERAAACVDAVVYAHEIDGELFGQYGLASLWQPFAVDPAIFPKLKPFSDRKPRAFFKGKAERFYHDDNCYRERRELIAYLRQHAPNVEVVDQYAFAEGSVLERNQQFIREMGDYQIVIGLPSLSPTMVVRPFEAMLSGCVFFQNQVEGERTRQLFRDGEHLVLYDATKPAELIQKIDELIAHPERALQIAENGRREVLAKHTLGHRVAELLPWLEQVAARNRSGKLAVAPANAPTKPGKIVIDGVIFELQQGRPHGISRVWHRLLEQLAKSPLASDIVLLDRNGTAPVLPGIRRRLVASYDYQRFEPDSLWLQRWCEEEKAALFISTYFTYAETTPTVIVLHDMIPELTGQNLQHPEWRAKTRAMQKAIGYCAVSQSTVNDFHRLHPQFAARPVALTPNAVGDDFHVASGDQVQAFRQKHNLRKPYFLLVGHRGQYKNAHLFFKAFAQLPDRNQYEIVCVGGAPQLEAEFLALAPGMTCQVLRLSDEELAAAYSGAVALAYPSKYEGFGLPILEAQKCDCPVITCRNSSLVEVAGDSVIYVGEADEAALRQALLDIQRPEVRQTLLAAGRNNVSRFSWESTGNKLTGAIRAYQQMAVSLPPQATDPMDCIRRVMFLLDQGDETARQLSIQLRVITWQYEEFEHYSHARTGAAEAAAAALLNQLGPRFREQIAPVAQLDGLTALALGLAAEVRKDWREAWACYSHALTRPAGKIFGFRLAIRMERVAASGGDGVMAESVRRQLVPKFRKILPENLEAGVEEKAVLEWPANTPAANPAAGRKPIPAPAKTSAAPLVTAIVSTYKSERFLRGCLEDLEAQTIAGQIEIIVVDSHSPQNERAIVEEFQKRYANIVYIRTQERETVYGAWNRGVRAARGKYLTNANTDDRHRADALEILAHTLETNPDVTLAYADCLITSHENETYETGTPFAGYRWLEFNAQDLWLKGCFAGPQPMWRREAHDEHGYFDAQMVSAGDYEFWLRLAQNRKFLHVPQVLGLYLKSPSSVEHANRDMGAKEVALARERYRDSIMAGKPPFRPKLPDPTAQVEIMTGPSDRGVSALPPAPKPVPMVARVGQLDEARALFALQNLPEAWAATLRAIGKRPFHPEAYLLLAEIALAAGAGKHAKQCAQRARDFAPGWSEVKQFLCRPLKGEAKPNWLVLPQTAGHRLSVCMIVKNEERLLAQCLKSIRGFASQMVVVDTGSTDRTVEIAREFGAEIHSFAWCDDFSAARNAALEHATGDWILILDADEELPAAQHPKLITDMKHGNHLALCLPRVEAGQEILGRGFTPRLWRNAPGVFYRGRIHEQPFPSLLGSAKKWGLKTGLGTAEIVHHGSSVEVVRDRNKIERNLKLLRAALQDDPTEVNLLMNLGLELVRSDELTAGIEKYREAYDQMSAQPAGVSPEMREALLTQFTFAKMRAAQPAEKPASQGARPAGSHNQADRTRTHGEVVQILTSPLALAGGLTSSLHFALGRAYLELKQFREAADQMRQCLTKRRQPCLTPINTDVLTAAPHHCLALCLVELHDLPGAEKAFVAAVAETSPAYDPRMDYAIFLRNQNRPAEALTQLHGFITANPQHAGARRLQAAWSEVTPHPATAEITAVAESQPSPVPSAAPAAVPAAARLGQLQEARELLERKDLAAAWAKTLRALAERPFHPEAFLLLAEIARAAGAGKTAKRHAQRARELAPGWPAVKQFLNQPLPGDAKLDWLQTPASLLAPAAPRLSVCLIVKNEEKFLAQCLNSVRGFASQLIVVDTGSTDRTVEIAREFGAEIHRFAWCDDFAAARNAALEQATGDWVLMLDADEELPAGQHAKLVTDMNQAGVIAFRLPLVNVGQENEGRSFVPRLFRNAPGVCFTGRIHEQVFASLLGHAKQWGLKTALGSAELRHYGYAQDLVRDRNKVERNLKLLRAATAENPADVNLQMNLGLELVRSGDLPAGLEKYRLAYDLMAAQRPEERVPELREALLTQITSQLYKVRAHEEVVRILRSRLAQAGGLTASLHFALGLAQFELRQFSEAADQMRQCLAKRQAPGLTPINTDILTAAPAHCLALCLVRLGDRPAAEKAFLAALSETGNGEAARLDYAQFLQNENRAVDALQQLHRLVTANSRHLAGWQLGGEITLGRPEFLEFALDWTAAAFQALPENPVLAAQRAEALLLNRQTSAAAPLWENLWRSEPQPRTLAALILCELAAGQPPRMPNAGDDERATSVAFVQWYQKLIAARAKPVLEAINSRLAPLARTLPTAEQMLQAALSEADPPVAVP